MPATLMAVGVLGRECVTPLAVRRPSASRTASVLPRCHGLHVRRVHASPILTAVVELHPVRYRPNEQLVDPTMGAFTIPVRVACAGDKQLPDPAASCRFYVVPLLQRKGNLLTRSVASHEAERAALDPSLDDVRLGGESRWLAALALAVSGSHTASILVWLDE